MRGRIHIELESAESRQNVDFTYLRDAVTYKSADQDSRAPRRKFVHRRKSLALRTVVFHKFETPFTPLFLHRLP